ncbi:hypothetical protein QQZ08_000999 [Neonectria magnoliae]|uniref:Methyltransferase type 11 domain-containing protein n=1 Tax=Neonectria magnoliae TaxID=2732573 RepID=A0ABR1IGL6_9HYPO
MIWIAPQTVPSATFEQLDFRDFTAEPATYDVVTSYFAMLVALSQKQIRETLRNICHWFKSGGLLIFSTVPDDYEHFEHTWLSRKAISSSLSVEQFTTLLAELGMYIKYSHVHNFNSKTAEVGLCRAREDNEEPQLFLYARKAA